MAIDTAAAARRAYQPPRLNVLGDISSLTEAGSVSGTESEVGPITGTCYMSASSAQYNTAMC